MEQLPRKYPSHAEMMKRVVRFNDLVGFGGGLPGSACMLFDIIGFQPLSDGGGVVTSPAGGEAVTGKGRYMAALNAP